MTSKQAIDKIMGILGLTNQKFFEAKTDQGIVLKMEGELELGTDIYVSTQEGMIPAPDGSYTMEDGSQVEVADGKISKIKVGDMEDSIEEEEVPDTVEEDMSQVNLEFGDVKLKDGSVIRIGSESPMVGIRVLKVGYDNTLSALSDGDYETADGKVISIQGGSIQGVQSVAEKKAQGGFSSFTIAEASGGVKLESPTFDVGEEVYVLDGDAKSPAPDGEHQVVLKDESGNENKIRIITKDGKIVERENVEGMGSDMMSVEQIASIFAQALKKIETKIDSVSEKQSQLESKFKKFSMEPAGERVFTQKTINTTSTDNSKFEAFKQMRSQMFKTK